ncbi:MAG TPA: maleylpyruvate isomerase N-terminal domain-containing protein [Microthrixaceae bacterium]|jgi:uncharacterized protein (TIGR03083 family)|nr:maleylpyruvate isomerase N-terminal domain-containing protein [Microthrixaceae bacterium]HQF92975.1 maleylpyruvate isomerase N-terminal domain-containing protein [Microthrixaceae bacterium]
MTALVAPLPYDEIVELLAEASAAFVDTVVGITSDEWSEPGLGVWNVRELVGHTMRAFSTVHRFLDEPVDRVEVETAPDYFRIALGSSPGIHDQVADRGREAGVLLGDDPVASVVEDVSRLLGRLGEMTGDEIGVTVVGGMLLPAYLDTRLVELVVHLSDLCVALGRPAPDLGRAGVRVAALVFASASVEDRDTVVRAMLGRADLPPGFNVWP